MALYDRIGRDYDTTRQADPEIARRLLHHLEPRTNGLYLDVACGTGNYTTALANAGLRMVGADQSARMLGDAARKARHVIWIRADAEALPFADGAFDGAICTLAIHHFHSLRPAFREVARVLKHGCFVVFTAGRDQMRRYWLNEYFPRAMARSIEQMPDLAAVREALHQAGLRIVAEDPFEVTPKLQNFFLYSGKHRPELYLDARIRAGISTFARLAEESEVREGCARLSEDISSGRVAQVVERYRHDGGDYLFVVAETEGYLQCTAC
jgi:SAM-dependent methyltransferase